MNGPLVLTIVIAFAVIIVAASVLLQGRAGPLMTKAPDIKPDNQANQPAAQSPKRQRLEWVRKNVWKSVGIGVTLLVLLIALIFVFLPKGALTGWWPWGSSSSADVSAPSEPTLSTEKETIVAKEGGSQWYLMPPPAPAGSPYRVIVCWWPGPSPATYTVRINHDPGRVWTPGDYAGASITSFQYVAARGQIALTAQVRRVRQDADPAHVCDW